MTPDKDQLQAVAVYLENASLLLANLPFSQKQLAAFKKKFAQAPAERAAEQAIAFFASMHRDIKEQLAVMSEEPASVE